MMICSAAPQGKSEAIRLVLWVQRACRIIDIVVEVRPAEGEGLSQYDTRTNTVVIDFCRRPRHDKEAQQSAGSAEGREEVAWSSDMAALMDCQTAITLLAQPPRRLPSMLGRCSLVSGPQSQACITTLTNATLFSFLIATGVSVRTRWRTRLASAKAAILVATICR